MSSRSTTGSAFSLCAVSLRCLCLHTHNHGLSLFALRGGDRVRGVCVFTINHGLSLFALRGGGFEMSVYSRSTTGSAFSFCPVRWRVRGVCLHDLPRARPFRSACWRVRDACVFDQPGSRCRSSRPITGSAVSFWGCGFEMPVSLRPGSRSRPFRCPLAGSRCLCLHDRQRARPFRSARWRVRGV